MNTFTMLICTITRMREKCLNLSIVPIHLYVWVFYVCFVILITSSSPYITGKLYLKKSTIIVIYWKWLQSGVGNLHYCCFSKSRTQKGDRTITRNEFHRIQAIGQFEWHYILLSYIQDNTSDIVIDENLIMVVLLV